VFYNYFQRKRVFSRFKSHKDIPEAELTGDKGSGTGIAIMDSSFLKNRASMINNVFG
jgi:hypothetical protein